MPESKTADAAKVLLRLPKGLHKWLTQQARRGNRSLNAQIVNVLEAYRERLKALAAAETEAEKTEASIEPDYEVPLTEVGLFTPEFARARWKGGHPPLSFGAAIDVYRRSQEAGVSPTEYFERLLRERGINPDAPYEPPAGTSEPEKVVLPPAGTSEPEKVVLPDEIFHKKKPAQAR
jgi:hypothetical protein